MDIRLIVQAALGFIMVFMDDNEIQAALAASYEEFGRNLFAAWLSHRMRISVAHARKRYGNQPLGAYWTDLACQLDREMQSRLLGDDAIEGSEIDELTDEVNDGTSIQ
jgi:hypothetical protein